jgi:hypothetical protein
MVRALPSNPGANRTGSVRCTRTVTAELATELFFRKHAHRRILLLATTPYRILGICRMLRARNRMQIWSSWLTF